MKRLNCLAINPQWYTDHFLSFPLGLGTIAAICKQMGHQVKVIDFDAERVSHSRRAAYIESNSDRPDVVLITGMITTFHEVQSIVADVRNAWGSTTIILGGGVGKYCSE